MKHIPPPPPLPPVVSPIFHQPTPSSTPAPPPLPPPVTNNVEGTAKTPECIRGAKKDAGPQSMIQKLIGGVLSFIVIVILYSVGTYFFKGVYIEWQDVTAKYLNNPSRMEMPEYQKIQSYLKAHPEDELRFIEVKFSNQSSKQLWRVFRIDGKSLKIRSKGQAISLTRCPDSVDLSKISIQRGWSEIAVYWVIVDAALAKDIDAKAIKIEYQEISRTESGLTADDFRRDKNAEHNRSLK